VISGGRFSRPEKEAGVRLELVKKKKKNDTAGKFGQQVLLNHTGGPLAFFFLRFLPIQRRVEERPIVRDFSI